MFTRVKIRGPRRSQKYAEEIKEMQMGNNQDDDENMSLSDRARSGEDSVRTKRDYVELVPIAL